MGGRITRLHRQGRNVRVLLCRRDAMARRHDNSPAPDNHRPVQHRIRLLRRLDLRGRRVPARLRIAMGDRDNRHHRGEEPRRRRDRPRAGSRRHGAGALAQVSSVPGCSTDAAGQSTRCSLVLRLDPPFDPRRLLEAVEHPGSVREREGACPAFRRLVRRVPARRPGELRRHVLARRLSGGAPASAHRHRPVGSPRLGPRNIESLATAERPGGRSQ